MPARGGTLQKYPRSWAIVFVLVTSLGQVCNPGPAFRQEGEKDQDNDGNGSQERDEGKRMTMTTTTTVAMGGATWKYNETGTLSRVAATARTICTYIGKMGNHIL
jgi:hypothetical protein